MTDWTPGDVPEAVLKTAKRTLREADVLRHPNERKHSNAALRVIIANALLAARGECFWSVDDNGLYHTDCGHTWEFTSAGPEENGAKWCIYCGKALLAARAAEEGMT